MDNRSDRCRNRPRLLLWDEAPLITRTTLKPGAFRMTTLTATERIIPLSSISAYQARSGSSTSPPPKNDSRPCRTHTKFLLQTHDKPARFMTRLQMHRKISATAFDIGEAPQYQQ